MKKIFNLIAVGMVLASVNVNAQTYVNEMTQADVERDCYIEGVVLCSMMQRMPIMEMVVMYKSHRLLLLLHLYLIETFGEIKI